MEKYEEAEKIFKMFKGNFDSIEENGYGTIYANYDVPKELEIKWAREEIDNRLDELSKEHGSYIDFKHGAFILQHEYQRYFSKEELVRLYNIVTSKVSELNMPTRVQLECLADLYWIGMDRRVDNDPEYIAILKEILKAYKQALESGYEFSDSRKNEYNILTEAVNKCSSKK